MIQYEQEVLKSLKKGLLPKEIFVQMDNAFKALELTKDLSLFDIKKLKSSSLREYYRLRKRKYRALFYFSGEDICVFKIDKREDVYKI